MAQDEMEVVGAPARSPSASRLAALVREGRPRQWVKNGLVFAAPGAAGVLDQSGPLVDTLIAFACFCLAASGTYYLNDAADVDADRRHPTKRFRPVAAGLIPVGTARSIGVALVAAGVGLGFAARWELALAVAVYVAVTTAYTVWLKHVAVVDLVAVAGGFVLRTIGGAAATDVPISEWFFIVASFGSLFMVVGKRVAEVRELGDGAGTRATLEVYTERYLGYLLSVSSGVVLVAYCLWAFDEARPTTSSMPFYELSILPFVLGVLRYALLIDAGKGGAPEEVVLSDRVLQGFGLAWAVAFGIGVYAG